MKKPSEIVHEAIQDKWINCASRNKITADGERIMVTAMELEVLVLQIFTDIYAEATR